MNKIGQFCLIGVRKLAGRDQGGFGPQLQWSSVRSRGDLGSGLCLMALVQGLAPVSLGKDSTEGREHRYFCLGKALPEVMPFMSNNSKAPGKFKMFAHQEGDAEGI